MTGANLTQAVIKSATLNKTVMAGTTLAKVIGRQLTGVPASLPANWAVIAGSLVGPGADLSNDNLSGADLSNRNLTGTIFDHSNLSNANLANANLTGASFIGAIVTGANLDGANLAGDNLSGIVSGDVAGTPGQLAGRLVAAGRIPDRPGGRPRRGQPGGPEPGGRQPRGGRPDERRSRPDQPSKSEPDRVRPDRSQSRGCQPVPRGPDGRHVVVYHLPEREELDGPDRWLRTAARLPFWRPHRTGAGQPIRKSAHSFQVRFRLTNFSSQKVTDSIGRSLTSAKEVRVTLSGPRIKAVSANCSWNSAMGKFQCRIHFPSKVKKGKKHNYKLTVSENFGLGFARAPTRAGAANPAIIHFR